MKYPYYIVPAVEEYKNLDPNSEEARKLGRLIAANIGDLPSLRLILGIDPPEFARFYPDMETSTPSTLDTIDSFLDKFGSNLQPLGYMARDESGKPGKEINEDPATQLAKFISDHRYDDALQLIECQNLNNPQKSIYFAHQMRFIKKLMAIENYRNKTKG